jgi:hypothetical protein
MNQLLQIFIPKYDHESRYYPKQPRIPWYLVPFRVQINNRLSIVHFDAEPCLGRMPATKTAPSKSDNRSTQDR